MGGIDHKAMEVEQQKSAAFHRKAEYEGWACTRCSSTPVYEERELYFERKLCGFCAASIDKSD